MRLFIYEYTCAVGHVLSASLRAEGWAMLAALLEDFGRVAGVEVVTLFHPRHDVNRRQGSYRAIRTEEEETAFRDLARSSAYTLVIAPEVDDLLLARSRWVEESGGRLLGSSPDAVRLTGDKFALGRHLFRRNVPTPECRPWGPEVPLPPFAYPWVWKPRYGAGSMATFLISNPGAWGQAGKRARTEGWTGESVVQPFVPGQPASVAFLMGPRPPVPLLPAAQELSVDGRFRYLGGRIPLPPHLSERVVHLARPAVATVDGLAGFVGVDVVLGNAADGREDWVIEINPRFTTSYVGLRALARTNLAEAVWRAALGEPIPTPCWHSGTLRFKADGTLARNEL